jgi:hypothetical protein
MRPLEPRGISTSSLPTSGRPVVWLGAVSFEERCTGALQVLIQAETRIADAVIVDYPTYAEPRQVDSGKRRKHRTDIVSMIRSSSRGPIDDPLTIHPYRLSPFRRALRKAEWLASEKHDAIVVVDTTCITKAHAISLAAWLAKGVGAGTEVLLAYTSPGQYGTPARHSSRTGKWVETVLAPCELRPDVFFEEANGIVLLGHEGPRLELALAQLTPIDALFVLATTPGEEELEIVARTSNARIVGRIERKERAGWEVRRINGSDVEALQQLVEPFVERSIARKRRVVLYPFGPKPLVLAASIIAIGRHPGGVWYCYPVPRAYDVDYTIGTGATHWFDLVS